jgi:hypothetical protein
MIKPSLDTSNLNSRVEIAFVNNKVLNLTSLDLALLISQIYR